MQILLTPEKISLLREKPISFTSTFAEGKLMTISPNGTITLAEPGKGYDQKWVILPIKDKEVLITSSKNGDMICHHMENEGNVNIKSLSDDTEGCIWKIGKGGEIYQDNPLGGERYLWMADDKLFVTLDGFLAEKWVPLMDIEQPKEYYPEKSDNSAIIFVIVMALFLIFFSYFLNW